MPHTADIRVEAWASSREECVTQAVYGLVDAFADVTDPRPVDTVSYQVGPGPDGDLLFDVLDEVIFRLDAIGRLPVGVTVTATGGDTLTVRLELVDADQAELVGAVPKAVSWSDLHLAPGPDGWTCAVTLDV